MDLPDEIKIGGHIYRVTFPYHFRETGLRAQVDHDIKEIRVTDVDHSGTPLAPSAIFVAFIHEIVHAIDMVIGHHIFHSNEHTEDENEKMLEGLSEGIFQVLVDNGVSFGLKKKPKK